MGALSAPGFVTGLPFERRIVEATARRLQIEAVAVRAAGNDPAAAGRLATQLAAAGVDRLISFGLCGALAPGLEAGDLVVAETVLCLGQPPLDLAPLFRPTALALRTGRLVSVDVPVTTPAAKAALARRSGAIAVDVESYAIAAAAQAAGIGCIVARVVADEAADGIPAAALAGLGPDGGVQPLRVIAALGRRPGELGPLVKLARRTRRARATLGRVVPLLLA